MEAFVGGLAACLHGLDLRTSVTLGDLPPADALVFGNTWEVRCLFEIEHQQTVPSSVLAPSSDARSPCSFLFLAAMPFVPSSFLLLE